jgi:hypothetical protein
MYVATEFGNDHLKTDVFKLGPISFVAACSGHWWCRRNAPQTTTFAISECHHIVAQLCSRCDFLEKMDLAKMKWDAIRRNTRAPTSPDRLHGARPNLFPGSHAKCNVTCMCVLNATLLKAQIQTSRSQTTLTPSLGIAKTSTTSRPPVHSPKPARDRAHPFSFTSGTMSQAYEREQSVFLPPYQDPMFPSTHANQHADKTTRASRTSRPKSLRCAASQSTSTTARATNMSSTAPYVLFYMSRAGSIALAAYCFAAHTLPPFYHLTLANPLSSPKHSPPSALRSRAAQAA